VVETGYKQALAEAVAAARAEELRLRTEGDQLDLFGVAETAVQGTQVPVANGHGDKSRMGRPVGSHNRRTDEAARIYMAMAGEILWRERSRLQNYQSSRTMS
jgi:hypothetical protein